MKISPLIAAAIVISLITIGSVLALNGSFGFNSQEPGGNGLVTGNAHDGTLFDSVEVSTSDEVIKVGHEEMAIHAKLMKDGRPARIRGINIEFSTDNDAMAVIKSPARAETDVDGVATVTFESNQTVGKVSIVATAYIGPDNPTSGNAEVNVVGWGTVSGYVTDKNKNGVPLANVTMWKAKVDPGSSQVVNVAPYVAPENPQLTSDGSTAAPGTYSFERVPWGLYNVTAEKQGHMYFTVVNVSSGTHIYNIAMPDYIYPGDSMIVPDTAIVPVASPVHHVMTFPLMDKDHGMITGMITDKDSNGVPGANVTIWHYIQDSNGQGRNEGKVNVKDNPQLTGDGSAASRGIFEFINLPYGWYNITADKDGHMYFATVNLTAQRASINIAIPDYRNPG